MAVCLTRNLFQSWDFLQVAPVLKNLDLWIEALENGLLRHQANAVPEVLDFDAILSGPICFFPQSQSLCNRDPLPRFVCKQRAALPGILELLMKNYETSIGNIENSQTLPTQDKKKDETCTNEYEWIWSFSRFSQWLYPVLRHGGVCRLGRSLGTEKAKTSNAASNCRLCPLCRSPLTYDYGTWWLNTHLLTATIIKLSSQCPGVSQMSPEVLPPPVLQDVPLQVHLPKKTPTRKSKWGREKKTWNGECITPGTVYNSHVDIWYCGQLGFMVDVNTHPHCLAKGILPWSFLACCSTTVSSTRADYPSSRSQVMLQLLLPRHWNHGGQCIARHNVRCSKLHAFIPGHRPPQTHPIQQLMSQNILVAWNINPALHPAAE